MANFPDSDTKVVLVVEDDPLVRDRVSGILTEAGFDVMTAGDNQEALAIVRMLDDRLGLVLVGSDPI
jgi:DNA-binding response OmpR family regulator